MKVLSRKHGCRSVFIRQWAYGLAVLLALVTYARAADLNAPVWNLELEVRVANIADAGTDNFVSVRLNEQNLTWMNSPRDDFERNSSALYSLRMNGIPAIEQLNQILISKGGSDGLCLDAIILYVNGLPIYSENLNNLWLDNDGVHALTYHVDTEKLRNNFWWIIYQQPPVPMAISGTELERRIEGVIGSMTGPGEPLSGFRWGFISGRAVEVNIVSDMPDALAVDLDLEIENNNDFNEVADIDFKVRVFFDAENRLRTEVFDVQHCFEHTWYDYVLFLRPHAFQPSGNPDSTILEAFTDLYRGLSTPMRVAVQPDGGLRFVPATNPPPVRPPSVKADSASTPFLFDSLRQMSDGGRSDTLPVLEKSLLPLAQLDEKTRPLMVEVENGLSDFADKSLPYRLRIKSNVAVNNQVVVQLKLPAGLAAQGSVIEVVDAKGKRTLNAQLTFNKLGETTVSFNDWMPPGAESVYALRLACTPGLTAVLPVSAIVTNRANTSRAETQTTLNLKDGRILNTFTQQISQRPK